MAAERQALSLAGRMKSKGAIEALAALGQESRLAIVRLLFRAGPEGLSAGNIGERLTLPAPTLSFHLAHLHRAGLVSSRREGNSIIYAASYGGMNALILYLTRDCCRGHLETGADTVRAPGAVPATIQPGAGSHEAPPRIYRR
jgi:DNA-binding transcriptional ArsR family regulator